MVRVCRSLKLNAMSMGNFADAGELTYLEKTHERRALYGRGEWAQWLGSLLQNWLWGYGEKPWRLALFMAFNIVDPSGPWPASSQCSKARPASAPSVC